MAISEQDIFGDVSSGVVSVTPPGASKPVYLRNPSFAEWHELARLHNSLDGKPPEAALIARTIATCLATADGKPITDASARDAVLKSSPRLVMWLYRKCWDTVLRSDNETVEAVEKN